MNELPMQNWRPARAREVIIGDYISHSFDLRRSDFVICLHMYVRGWALRRSPVSGKIRIRVST
jgi:hypothetical protein